MCKLCEERGKTWKGDDPKCAFNENGNFMEDFDDNWNCETLNQLRSIAHDNDLAIFSNDEWAAVIPYRGSFIFLQWYKHRGRTHYVHILNNTYDLPTTDEHFCLEIIKYWRK